MPLNTSEIALEIIAKSLGEEARKYNVTIIAGQTAAYYGLEIPLLTSTCLGQRIRSSKGIAVGDKILLIGEIGGEAVWLDCISRGEKFDSWSDFTPLPIILSLQHFEEVKLIHDVSEGGLKRALYEITSTSNHGMRVSTDEVKLYPGSENLRGDVFRAPTYGSLVVIVDTCFVSHVQEVCGKFRKPCSILGEVVHEKGLFFNKKLESVEDERIEIDELYGSFSRKDPILKDLSVAVDRALEQIGLSNLIPEVGSNIVYAKPSATSLNDVAGLSGRIIKTVDGPIACGEYKYGASRFLSSVVLQALTLNSSIRSAINIRGGKDIKKTLEKLGLKIKVLPSRINGEGCPVTIYLRSSDTLYDAYIHPGGHGIEPTTTILGKNPGDLIDVIEKMIKHE